MAVRRGEVDHADGSGDGLTIVDYKTGRAPSLKYSAAANERIRESSFFQLRCYALLLARGGPPSGFDRGRAPPVARKLRLLYLRESEDGGGATCLEEELPRDEAAYEALLKATEDEILSVWRQITALVEAGDPTAFEHCSRPFCQCHDMRPLVFPDVQQD